MASYRFHHLFSYLSLRVRALTSSNGCGSAPRSHLSGFCCHTSGRQQWPVSMQINGSQLGSQLFPTLQNSNLVTSFSHQTTGEEEEEEAMNQKRHHSTTKTSNVSASKKKAIFMAAIAVSKFRSALAAAITRHQVRPPRVVGTLYGRRRGHLHLSFQLDAQTHPAALLELQTPTNELVREMATSGLMRIALECDRGGAVRLIDEPMWRVYCNGLRCGYAVRRECRPEDWKVLRAVEPVSVGAGVLPAGCGEEGDEVMYMRAMFERVVGSGDSEAFYMMSPDGHAGPELCVYLLRV